MFEEQKNWPVYQMIKRRSLAPLWEQFNAKNRGRILPNLNQGLMSFAIGANARGGMPLAKPVRNYAPSVESMLSAYTKRGNGVNPKFNYKGGAGYFNNTLPENRRAMAASYLSKFNNKKWFERPR